VATTIGVTASTTSAGPTHDRSGRTRLGRGTVVVVVVVVVVVGRLDVVVVVVVDGPDVVVVVGPVTVPVQVVPFRAKLAGFGFELPLIEAVKPKLAVPPVPRVPFHPASLTDTDEPDCEPVPFQSWVMV
jgi:hypothetical protein